MPELPEVETIRRDLLPLVRGRTVLEAWVSPDAPRLVQSPSCEEFCRALAGRRIEDLQRRGKLLLFVLDGGRTWAVHLRMTGQLLHRRGPCHGERYLRAAFRLDDGSWLCFVDVRKFGAMWLVGDMGAVAGELGPEPLDPGFSPGALQRILERRSAPVKAVLLDQKAIAGIGNIYADEALFVARINPKQPANSLSLTQARRLHGAIRQVLTEALADRGSSFRDYVDAAGREGTHQFKVSVFRRTGQPCYRCGSPVQRVKVAGRSTHFCPNCQPLGKASASGPLAGRGHARQARG
jgi:formamidopyrimidine-DNA glycosylase